MIFWIVKVKREYNFQNKKQLKLYYKEKIMIKNREKIMGNADENYLIEKILKI